MKDKDKKIQIKPSTIHGKGVFLDENLFKNEIVGLTHERSQPVTELGLFHNHSEFPNTESILINGKRFLKTLESIKKGEELTVDYKKQPELEQPEGFNNTEKMHSKNLAKLQNGILFDQLSQPSTVGNPITNFQNSLPLGFQSTINTGNQNNNVTTPFNFQNSLPFGFQNQINSEAFGVNSNLFQQQRQRDLNQIDSEVVRESINPRVQESLVPTIRRGIIEPTETDLTENLNTLELTNTQKTDTGKTDTDLTVNQPRNISLINPFGGVDLTTALFKAGQSFGAEKSTGNTIRGIGAVGKSLFGIARTVGSGLGFAKREKEAMRLFEEQQRKGLINSNFRGKEGGLFFYLKNGGNISAITTEQALTGEYITGLPDHAEDQANAEIEVKEFVKHPNGDVQQVMGKTHAQGGEKVNLEVGTKVVSNHLTLGGDLASNLRKEYGVKVKAKDTYAKAIEKYTHKIGLKKLVDEQEALFTKLKKEEDTEDTSTRNLNTEFISGRIKEIEDEKLILEEQRASFTDFVFQEQESSKIGDKELQNLQDGGSITQDQLNQINELSDIEFNMDAANSLFQPITEEVINTPDPINVNLGKYASVNYFEKGELRGDTLFLNNTKDFPHSFETMKEMVNNIKQLNPDLKIKPNYIDFNLGGEIKNNPVFKGLLKKYNLKEDKALELIQEFNLGGQKKYQTGDTVGNPPTSFRFLDNEFLDDTNLGFTDSQNETTTGNGSLGINSRVGNFGFPTDEEQLRLQQLRRNFPVEFAKVFGENNQGVLEIIPDEQGQIQGRVLSLQRNIDNNYQLLIDEVAPTLPEDQREEFINQINLRRFQEKGKAARGFDDKTGLFTSTRTNAEVAFADPKDLQKLSELGITTRRQLFDNEGVLRKEVQELGLDKTTLESIDKFKGINANFLLGQLSPNEETTPITDSTPNEGETTVDTPKTDKKEKDEDKVKKLRTRLGFPLLPDQSTLPPDALQPHLKINRRFERLDPVKITAEENIKEIDRNQNFVTNQLNNLPDSQRRAALANLTANSQENINKAITQTNIANAQNFQQTEQFNINQSNNEENFRASDALDFERRQLTALGKTQADLFNFFEFNRKVQLGNFNTVNRLNLLNNIYENFNTDGSGINLDSNSSAGFNVNKLPFPIPVQSNNK